jgi:L-fuculose-phosphate aldolase
MGAGERVDDRQTAYERTQSDLAAALPDPGWSLRQKLALSARALAIEGHSSGLAGQITIRHDAATFWTLGFGLGFEEATSANSIRIDHELRVVEGAGIANPANRFHAWIYRARPDAGAIVHTHAPWSAALSMIGEPLVVAHMDATPLYDDVAYLADWPGVPVADDEGRIISEAIGTKRAILLAHHGLLTLGKSIEEATMLAIFMERACAMHMRARAVGPIKPIPPAHGRDAHDFLLSPLVVNATFAYFARGALRTAPDLL